MDGSLANFLKDRVSGEEIRLAVFPFQDGSLGEVDPTLEKAFALVFYDILHSQPKIGVYHPFLVFNTIASQGLSSADTFADDRVIAAAGELGATHVIYGMFQKKGTLLRTFVKVADMKTRQPAGQMMEFAAEQSDRFFSVATDTAEAVLKTIRKQGMNKASLKKFLEESPSFEAFRYYVKGMEKSHAFQEVNLGVAKVWFEKAAIASYTFQTAYEEMARTLFMLALMQKQTGKDFVLLMNEGHQILRRAQLAAGTRSASGKTKQSTLVDWLVGILEGRINPCGK